MYIFVKDLILRDRPIEWAQSVSLSAEGARLCRRRKTSAEGQESFAGGAEITRENSGAKLFQSTKPEC